MKFSIGTWETGSHVDLPIYVEADSINEAANKLGLKRGMEPGDYYIALSQGGRYEVHLHKLEEMLTANDLKKALQSCFGRISFS